MRSWRRAHACRSWRATRRGSPTAAAEVGGETQWRSADVTDPDAIAAAVGGLVEARGAVDLLITSAGVAHPGYFEQLPLDVFESQMDLIYFGTLHAIRAVLPAMLARGRGGLVGVASAAALVGVFGYGAYAPAKYAVRGLMETLHAEYSHRGIYSRVRVPARHAHPGFRGREPPEAARDRRRVGRGEAADRRRGGRARSCAASNATDGSSPPSRRPRRSHGAVRP